MLQMKQWLSFLGILVTAFLVLVIGFRLYFDEQHLTGLLKKTFTATELVAVKGGKAQRLDETYWGNTGEKSQVLLGSINIQTQWYDSLVINFLDKDTHQTLNLNILGKVDNQPVNISIPIFYTARQKATILFNRLENLPADLIIKQISLSTDKILGRPYAIKSIEFHPKTFSWTMFFQLLINNITHVDTLLDSPDTLDKTDNHSGVNLVEFNVMLLLYIFSFFILTLLYKLWRKKAIEPIILSLLAGIWIALDIHFIKSLLFSSIITQNSAVSFSGSIGLFGFVGLIFWVLGSAMSANCFKKRYGYLILNIGVGFWLALFVLIIGSHLSQGFTETLQSVTQWKLLSKSVLGIFIVLLVAVAVFFIYKFFPSRLCAIDEHRLEEACPNNHYFYSALLGLAIAIHLIFIVLANINIGDENTLMRETLFSPLASALSLSTHVVMIVFYIASLVSLVLFFYGALRYLGFSILTTATYLYLFSSLPVWLDNWQSILIAYLIGAIVLTTVIVFRFREWRLLSISAVLLGLFIYLFDPMLSDSVLSLKTIAYHSSNSLNGIADLLYSPQFTLLWFYALMSFFVLFKLRLMSRLDDTKGFVALYGFSVLALIILVLMGWLGESSFTNNLLSFSGVTVFLWLNLPLCYLGYSYKKD